MSSVASRPTSEQLKATLLDLQDPLLEKTFAELDVVKAATVDESGRANVNIVYGFPMNSQREAIVNMVTDSLRDINGITSVAVEVSWQVVGKQHQQDIPALAKVKHIVAVASGKGGVGKSTTAVNLALALAAEGGSVGLLDADIYGPSVPQMLGVGSSRPEVNGQMMLPVKGLGLYTNSMGYLVTENTPMVWRGPMAGGALQQLLTQTQWPELDYLVIDMPPGTGDIQLTLSQKAPLTGAVIVTTPQDIALLDGKKAIEMFRKVHVPVLGVVENMATHICSQCSHEEHIFGEGGGQRIATEYQTELLGALPLDLSIQRNADKGQPTVVSEPDSSIAAIYKKIAMQVGNLLANEGSVASPVIEIGD